MSIIFQIFYLVRFGRQKNLKEVFWGTSLLLVFFVAKKNDLVASLNSQFIRIIF